MQVRIKEYDNRKNYNEGVHSIEEVVKSSINDALSYSKKIIRKHKRAEHFIGFRIYDMTGKLKQKIHNQ